MATEINFTELNETQKLEAADLMQKLQAIDGALALNNDERVAASAVFNKKQYALEEKKKVIIAALRTLRTATIKEV